MNEAQQLINEQLFFRKELMERVQWFIGLRWMASGGGLIAAWAASAAGFPILLMPVSALLLFCAAYNGCFVLVRRRLESLPVPSVRNYLAFFHIQFALDLLTLFAILFYTGGFFSPILIFIFFHVMLTGILLEPLSCYLYSASILVVAGGMLVLQANGLPAAGPALLKHPMVNAMVDVWDMLAAYGIFAAAVVITTYFVTTLKISLRTKGRELLRVSKKLDMSNAKLRALYEMVKEMHMCPDLQTLADSATRSAAVIMGVRACSIKLLDEQRQKLRFVSAYGLSRDYTAKGPIDIDKSLVNLRVFRGDKVSIGRVDDRYAFQYPEDIQKEQIASLICLPLRVEKMIIGVFCIYSSEPDFFSGQDVDFFSLMADLTALGIENIRTHENKTWFLKKAAHQLRSPLNATYSMLDMLCRGYQGPMNPKQLEVLQRCMGRIQLLTEMVADLLKIGIKRVDAHKDADSDVDVRQKLKEVAEFYMPKAAEKDIDFKVEASEAVPLLRADPQLLDNLFSNLISNALKYTPSGGRVETALAMENNTHILFEVSDTGIGIPSEDISKIFTEFFRSENAKALTEQGTGLGLVIVKEAIDAINGSITVESTPGKGTRFFLRLPVSG